MTVRVSVVVAVYNTGEHIEPLIDSLARQSLPADQFEVVFVDDGSTDDTPARLDRLAAETPNVRVVHEPNSGWPGRPRNVGTDLATGTYVFYADHDDWFGEEALQRMADYADECGSDLLIPRYAGHHRGVAKALFTRNQPSATLESAPLMDSLTPHKLFRRSFLQQHRLRFPEGRRRLEDHVFVVEAFFLAGTISVLADYPCYVHVGRPDAGNAGYERIDPPSYYGYVREVVEIILKYTEPGPLRDRCLRRPLRQELLARLDGPAFLSHPPEYRRSVFDECRRLAEDLVPAEVDAGLSPPQRLRVRLLREDRFDDLVAYVQHQVHLQPAFELEDVQWREGGVLELSVSGRLVDGRTGRPLTYRETGDAALLDTPAQLSAEVPVDVLSGTSPLRSGRLQLALRRRADSAEWPLPTTSTQQLDSAGGRLAASYRAGARVDPRTLAGGRPLRPGVWDVYATILQTGWSKTGRLGAAHTAAAVDGCRPAVLAGTVVVPYWTAGHGELSVDLRTAGGVAGPRIRPHTRLSGRTLTVTAALAVDGPPPAVELVLRRPVGRADARRLPGTLAVTGTGEATVQVPVPDDLRAGLWRLGLAVDADRWGRPARVGAGLRVRRGGAVTLTRELPLGAGEPLTVALRRRLAYGPLGPALRRLRRSADALAGRLRARPSARALRRLAGRLLMDRWPSLRGRR